MLDISERGIQKFFKKNPRGWIVLKRQISIQTQTYFPNVAIEKILKEDFPDYYMEWKKSFFSDASMFYTDAKSFNEYCVFLFEVLFKLRRTVGEVDYVPHFKRYCSLTGQFLLTTYIERHHGTCKFVGTLINGTPFYRLLRHIAHKLNLNNKSRYYVAITNFLRKLTHSQPPMSSYSQE